MHVRKVSPCLLQHSNFLFILLRNPIVLVENADVVYQQIVQLQSQPKNEFRILPVVTDADLHDLDHLPHDRVKPLELYQRSKHRDGPQSLDCIDLVALPEVVILECTQTEVELSAECVLVNVLLHYVDHCGSQYECLHDDFFILGVYADADNVAHILQVGSKHLLRQPVAHHQKRKSDV